jgi:hypothetical protein
MEENMEMYKIICEPKFSDLKEDIGRVLKTVEELKDAVFNGLSTDVAFVKDYIDAVKAKKKARLTGREVLVRSLSVSIGGSVATTIILAARRFIIHIL